MNHYMWPNIAEPTGMAVINVYGPVSLKKKEKRTNKNKRGDEWYSINDKWYKYVCLKAVRSISPNSYFIFSLKIS